MDAIAKGNRIIIKVNDKTTTDYTDEKRRFIVGRIALQAMEKPTIVEFRKMEIQNNQSWVFAARFFESGSAIGRRRGRETGFAQVEREKIDYIAFILDDQNCVPGRGFHGSSPLSPKLFRFASEVFATDFSNQAAGPQIPEGDIIFTKIFAGDTRYVDRMLQLLVFGRSFSKIENR